MTRQMLLTDLLSPRTNPPLVKDSTPRIEIIEQGAIASMGDFYNLTDTKSMDRSSSARPGSLTKLPFRAGDRGMPRRLLSVLHQSVHVLCADQEVS